MSCVPEPSGEEGYNGYTAAVLRNTISQYARTRVRFSLRMIFIFPPSFKIEPSERSWDSLPGSEKAAMKELIKAAKYMDPIYNRSVQGPKLNSYKIKLDCIFFFH